jgi:hypothetical protein
MKYQIVRPFPASTPVQRGQIVEDPNWRNLNLLIKQGYVKVLEEPKDKTKGKNKPATETIADDVEQIDAEVVVGASEAPDQVGEATEMVDNVTETIAEDVPIGVTGDGEPFTANDVNDATLNEVVTTEPVAAPAPVKQRKRTAKK